MLQALPVTASLEGKRSCSSLDASIFSVQIQTVQKTPELFGRVLEFVQPYRLGDVIVSNDCPHDFEWEWELEQTLTLEGICVLLEIQVNLRERLV